jgi:hypothetical protein
MTIRPILLLLLAAGCATAKPEGRIVIHRECAVEVSRACKPGSEPFTTCELSEECASDLLFALNQRLGGGQR